MKQLAAGLIFFFLVPHFANAQPLPPDGGHISSNDSGSGSIAKQFVLYNATNFFPGIRVLQLEAPGFIASGKLLSAIEFHFQSISL